jgi:hypothetical protein
VSRWWRSVAAQLMSTPQQRLEAPGRPMRKEPERQHEADIHRTQTHMQPLACCASCWVLRRTRSTHIITVKGTSNVHKHKLHRQHRHTFSSTNTRTCYFIVAIPFHFHPPSLVIVRFKNFFFPSCTSRATWQPSQHLLHSQHQHLHHLPRHQAWRL